VLFSVVTPVRDGAEYLAEALDSVAALRTPHEHVVVDGGSTDGTADLLAARRDESLVWRSEPDRGQTHAVNKGLALARGDVIGWLNADDAYVPGAVDRALDVFAREPAVAVVFGGISFTDAAGRVRRTHVPGHWSFGRYLFLGDYVPTPSILFRRSALDRTGPLDERWEDAADYDLYLRMMHRARVERVAEPLVRFRYHGGSKTARDAMKAQREALEIRLRWARGRRDRAIMLGFDALKRAILPRISSWPEPYGRVRAWGAEDAR
jgi:glycosyltransferase involved in cell wall biosynthesis